VKSLIDLASQEQEIQRVSQDELQLLATLKSMKEEILDLGTKKPCFSSFETLEDHKKNYVNKLEELLSEFSVYEGVAYNSHIKGSKFITTVDFKKIQKLAFDNK
jgi:hypothetical protein